MGSREGRHSVLDGAENEFVDDLREDLLSLRLGANAAGFATAEPMVQAALLNLYAALQFRETLEELTGAMERAGDELRRQRKAREYGRD